MRKLNEEFEADYIAGANAAGVDGAEVLKYFKAEIARLADK